MPQYSSTLTQFLRATACLTGKVALWSAQPTFHPWILNICLSGPLKPFHRWSGVNGQCAWIRTLLVVFATWKVIGVALSLNITDRNDHIQRGWGAGSAAAIYSASAVDRETTSCGWDIQDTAPPAMVASTPREREPTYASSATCQEYPEGCTNCCSQWQTSVL